MGAVSQGGELKGLPSVSRAARGTWDRGATVAKGTSESEVAASLF